MDVISQADGSFTTATTHGVNTQTHTHTHTHARVRASATHRETHGSTVPLMSRLPSDPLHTVQAGFALRERGRGSAGSGQATPTRWQVTPTRWQATPSGVRVSYLWAGKTVRALEEGGQGSEV